MDVGTQQLYQCLASTLDPSTDARRSAEAALEAGGKQPGFGAALLRIVGAQEVPAPMRQLAAVVLKKHVREHWTFESAAFREPPIPEEEKEAIRRALPEGLADPASKLRTAVAMVIAAIARWECPQQWPALLPGLLAAVGSRDDPTLAAGAVQCLSLFVEELGEEQVMAMAPALLPELARVVGAEGGPAGLPRKALVIVRCVLGTLHTLAGTHPGEVKAMLRPLLADWLPLLAAVLRRPATSAAAWGLKTEALRVAQAAVGSFGKLAAPALPAVMAACWDLFTACLPLYQRVVVEGEEGEEEGDKENGGGGGEEEEGGGGEEESSLEGMVGQLLEFMLTLACSPRQRAAVAACLPQLVLHTLGYLQITAAQAERWAADPDSLVADEEDDCFSARASGEMLLDELVEGFESEAVAPLHNAVQAVLAQAEAARGAGRESWWRLREAALLGVGCVSERLVGLWRAGARGLPRSRQTFHMDLPGLTARVLREDLAPGTNPFLAGRALWLVSRLAEAVPAEQRAALLQAAAAGLAPGSLAPLRVGACRAVARLCEGASAAELAGVGEPIFAGLCELVGEAGAGEEVLHLALDTLSAAVAADPAAAARWEPRISPPTLAAWVAHIADPLLSMDARNLVAALAAVPACLPGLQARAVPTLAGIVAATPGTHPSVLVDGAVDLLTLLLSPSPPDVARAIHAAATPAVLSLAMGSDDAEVVLSATAYLRTLLQVGGADALTWSGGDAASSVGALLGAVQRLLGPEVEDRGCANVGGLLLELLRHAGPHIVPSLPALLGALAGKLESGEDPALVQSLLAVLAQLVHLDLNNTVTTLAAIPRGGGRSALDVVMAKWTERQIEVRTPYDIRLTTTALAALLAAPHPALDAVAVKGKRTDTGGRVRTRASKQVEQWSSVPLRVKLVMLLTDAYIEATTQDLHVDDGDSDGEWEEEDGSGSDGDARSDASRRSRRFGGGLEDLLELAAEAEEVGGLSNVDAREAARRRGDPLSSVDLAGHVRGVFAAVSAAQPGVMQAGAEQLTPVQMGALQQIFQAAAR